MGRISFWQYAGVIPFLSINRTLLSRPSCQQGGEENPILANAGHRDAIRGVVAYSGTLLNALRHHKASLARVMRQIKYVTTTIAGRAAMVLSAIAALSGGRGLTASAAYTACNRFLMLTAQHDDAMQDCPAAALAFV